MKAIFSFFSSFNVNKMEIFYFCLHRFTHLNSKFRILLLFIDQFVVASLISLMKQSPIDLLMNCKINHAMIIIIFIIKVIVKNWKFGYLQYYSYYSYYSNYWMFVITQLDYWFYSLKALMKVKWFACFIQLINDWFDLQFQQFQ